MSTRGPGSSSASEPPSVSNGNGVVVLSDMEKGIDNAVASLLPEASHGLSLSTLRKLLEEAPDELQRHSMEGSTSNHTGGIQFIHCGRPEHLTRCAEYILEKHLDKRQPAFFNGRRFWHSHQTLPRRRTRSSPTSERSTQRTSSRDSFARSTRLSSGAALSTQRFDQMRSKTNPRSLSRRRSKSIERFISSSTQKHRWRPR